MNIKFGEHREQIYVQGQQCDVVPACRCDYLREDGGDFEEALDLITVPSWIRRNDSVRRLPKKVYSRAKLNFGEIS